MAKKSFLGTALGLAITTGITLKVLKETGLLKEDKKKKKKGKKAVWETIS